MRHANIDIAQTRAIAKEAYVYGSPMVDHYRIQHTYFVNRDSPEFKAPWNHICNIARVFTPDDKAVQTPNSDTPYSLAGLDLRAEPIVLTVPTIEEERYFSIQLVDLYTHNFEYIGSRVTGNQGGHFLIVGPNWKGKPPSTVEKVIHSETELVFALYRTQVSGPEDLKNVVQVQAGYKVQPLSAFLGQPGPPSAPAIDFVKPLAPDVQKSGLEFFGVLNFLLRFCPTVPSEASLMERFAQIGVGAGRPFDALELSPEMTQALQEGIGDAWAEFARLKATQMDTGKVTSGQLFGTRAHLNGNYLYRMAGAIAGIYGNSTDEAMYPMYTVDTAGAKLDAAVNRYTLRFASGELPPVNAFWSLTMYELPASLLVANPIHRYVLNSAMLPNMVRDADGGLTVHICSDFPGAGKDANWLPAPGGPFWMAMRLYWPKAEAVNGQWTAPPVHRS